VQDDVRALEAWRGGDSASGNALLRRHFATLSRFFRGKVPEDERADLIQKTLLAAVESRDRVPDGLPFRAYLLGIARRVLVQNYRSADRSRRGRVKADPVPSSPSPSRAVVVAEEQRLLLRALRRLSFDLQVCIELFYWENLDTAAMAHVLEIPRGTVKSRLRRARDALKDAIAEVSDDPELTRSTIGDLDGWAARLKQQREAERDEL
jgi:RNA polymerase sigma-70 factor (ECF subfamily)